MYEWICRGDEEPLDGADALEALVRHTGDSGQLLRRYETIATRAVKRGPGGVRELAPRLLDLIADARTLRSAWDHQAKRGGSAPGPNGRRYRDYSSRDVWEQCRCLGLAIRRGSYRPGEEKIWHVPKSDGTNTRPIVLLDIQDRVVQRAVLMILQPLLDPLFAACSFGFRPRLGHLHAMAAAEEIAVAQRRHVWVVADVKDAFQAVPVSRLLDVVGKYLPDDGLVELLRHTLPAKRLSGLRQGGPLSPLMLNLYLHHFVDRKWKQLSPDLPMIRVADDMLVLCHDNGEAVRADANLRRLLTPAGLPLKFSTRESIRDLASGEKAHWLGFAFRKHDGGLAIKLAEKSWRRLDERLAIAHAEPDSPLRANRSIRGWLGQRGPSYEHANREADCKRIVDMAAAYAFDEAPAADELLNHWQLAGARCQKLRKKYQSADTADSETSNEDAEQPSGSANDVRTSPPRDGHHHIVDQAPF